jgi:hypothetical protein
MQRRISARPRYEPCDTLCGSRRINREVVPALTPDGHRHSPCVKPRSIVQTWTLTDNANIRTAMQNTKAAMEPPPNRPARRALAVGTQVEVRTRFCSTWSNGFKVAQTTDDGYWLRRESDQYLLPTPFVAGHVRQRS